MINPYRGCVIDHNWYNYNPDSFRFQIPLRNSSSDGQSNRNFSILGKFPPIFTITISLDNTYDITVGNSTIGSTTWLGVSRLEHLRNALGGVGDSMPVYFVTPYGSTHSVVPTGALDISLYNPSNPSDTSAEFYVSLTLEATV